MNDAVYNEYVHVDEIGLFDYDTNCAQYEPLEHGPVTKGTLRGAIYFPSIGRRIRFREGGEMFPPGTRRLLIDCNEALAGLIRTNGEIAIKWNDRPGEHYLCVSYEIGNKEEKSRVCWQKEGF